MQAYTKENFQLLVKMEKPVDRVSIDSKLQMFRASAVEFIDDSISWLGVDHQGTLWVATKIYDRTLAAWVARGANLSSHRVSLLVGVCVMLTCKLHDNWYVEVKEVAEWVDCENTMEVVLMEAEVLEDLQWMIYSTPPHAYVALLAEEANLRRKAFVILNMVGCDSRLCFFPSHQIAEAVLVVAAENINTVPRPCDLIDLVGMIRRLFESALTDSSAPRTKKLKVTK
jgi:hypothetical protein